MPEEKSLEEVDFNDPEGISSFKFPAAWKDDSVPIEDHVEAALHLSFLGINKGMLTLIRKWLADSPAAGTSGLQDSSFVECMQSLIKDLKRFNLSWLAACPLTGQKGNLGTGSRVGENIVFLARVSPIVFAAYPKDRKRLLSVVSTTCPEWSFAFMG